MQALLPKLGRPSLAAAATAARARVTRLPGTTSIWQDKAIIRWLSSTHSRDTAGHSLKAAAATEAAASSQEQPRQQQHATAEDAFYAEEAQSFADLGLANTLVAALQAGGFPRPSRVQVQHACLDPLPSMQIASVSRNPCKCGPTLQPRQSVQSWSFIMRM
jgi:hypothetical protein